MAEHDTKRRQKKMTVFYDSEEDILSLHKGFSPDEKFKGNIDAGDLILDISTKGRVKGVEIMHATRFLKEFSLGEKELQNLETAEFQAVMKPQGTIISLSFKVKHKEKKLPAKIAIPV